MTREHGEEIRGITLPVIRAFVGCTIVICSSVIGGSVYIKSGLTDHERRLSALEARDKEVVTPLYTDVTELKAWRNQVTAYYLPKK